MYYGEAERPPSYFSLERLLPEVGRVVRFDSVSKVLSAGIRIGFVSGPKPILDAIDLHVRQIGSYHFSRYQKLRRTHNHLDRFSELASILAYAGDRSCYTRGIRL